MGAVGSLRALLENIIDYAGLFPPATLGVKQAVEEYIHQRGGEYAWMLRNFVVPASKVHQVPQELPLSVIETDPAREEVAHEGVTYFEAPPDEAARLGGRAKIRTGGLVPDAVPAVEYVERFLSDCRVHGLAFKATAGLHHPVRGEHLLTYEQGSEKAVMHGFLNVFMAASFLYAGRPQVRVLEETDPTSFRFHDACARWRDATVSTEEIQRARREFAISFGSCSFADPVADLRELNLI